MAFINSGTLSGRFMHLRNNVVYSYVSLDGTYALAVTASTAIVSPVYPNSFHIGDVRRGIYLRTEISQVDSLCWKPLRPDWWSGYAH